MRILLAELAPVRADVPANLARLVSVVSSAEVDLAVFPELYLSGYLLGDRVHPLALARDGPEIQHLQDLARRTHRAIAVGAPLRHAGRPGEVENAAVFVDPEGRTAIQSKRFLPTFGPFEEGQFFTPVAHSHPFPLGAHSIGVEICYDAFFPEVTRDLALAGAQLFLNLSASPVTSRSLFERVLPARAVENGVPMVYVNRVGVEDGIVFGGGSGAWDARGAPRDLTPLGGLPLRPEERLVTVELDLSEGPRWRPFRPVLRDVARTAPLGSSPSGRDPSSRAPGGSGGEAGPAQPPR